MIEFFHQHSAAISVAGYYVFSALLGAMPEPKDTSSDFYHFFYRFMQLLSANFTRMKTR